MDLDVTSYTHPVCTGTVGYRWAEGHKKDLAVYPDHGTGQGDIHSLFTWLAVFDVLLRVSENTPVTEHHFPLRNQQGLLYAARDMFCEGPIVLRHHARRSATNGGSGLCLCYMVFNRSIATFKLRAFHFCGSTCVFTCSLFAQRGGFLMRWHSRRAAYSAPE